MQNRPGLRQDGWCFACGPNNPHGLRLTDFCQEGEECVVKFTPQREHQGWDGLTHGGIVATLLDESMTHLLQNLGQVGVTAVLTVRYHRPLPTGKPVEVRARVVACRRRLWQVESEFLGHEGAVIASAQAKFMVT